MEHRVVLDLVGTLAQSAARATVIRPGTPGIGSYLPEGVASWAADLDRPVVVDLSELPADEQRDYARSFAEGWTDAGTSAPLVVHALDQEQPRWWLPASIVATCLAIIVMPVTAAVVVGAVGGLALGLLLGPRDRGPRC